jgi:cathepsin B
VLILFVFVLPVAGFAQACGLGCSGGYPFDAWTYLSTTGAVTGGEFNSSGVSGGCLPFSLPPCVHQVNGTEIPCDSLAPSSGGGGGTRTPVCVRQCQNGQRWSASKYCTSAPYRLASGDVTAIQAELFYHGPVTATLQLFQDFPAQLPNAVYSHAKGKQIGALSVKLLGWGSDFPGPNQIDYWLVANSWGAGWGNKGFFKIARGRNECDVEKAVVAAMTAECPLLA